MTSQGYLLGIDLGTSNTVAVMRRPDGQSRPLLLDGAPLMPSGVLLDQRGHLHVGRDARRLALLDPGRFEAAPKRRIDDPTVHLGDRDVPTVDLLAALLSAISRAAIEAVGFLPPVVMTYPAAWGADRQQVLRRAAERAGYPPVELIPEPVAAARYFTDVLRRPVPLGGTVAVFDFGGGTLDIAVLRREPSGFVPLAVGGHPSLGGSDVDAAIAQYVAETAGAGHPHVWQTIARPHNEEERRAHRMFWDDVQGAKEMLSRTATAPVGVPGLGQTATLSRDDLDRLAAPIVDKAVALTEQTLVQAGVAPSSLAGLFLVGGSSRLPAVARSLHGRLGVAPVLLEQPELPVAEGALAQFASTAAATQQQPPARATPTPRSSWAGA